MVSSIITHSMESAEKVRNKNYEKSASIMATKSADRTSSKYTFVPTFKVLEKLEKSGYEVKDWRETKAQSDDRKGFQKHIIRLRKAEQADRLQVGDIIPEIVLTNAHDAGAAFKLMAGLFRCWCSNQCVTSEATVASHRVLHRGYTHDQILNAVNAIVEDTPKVIESVTRFGNILLSPLQRQTMGEQALEILYGDEEKNPDKWEEFDLNVSAQKLIVPIRSQDSPPNLWTTYNTIQEKFLKGGRFMVTKEEADYYNRQSSVRLNWLRTKKTKKIKAIDKDVNLNRNLWNLAEGTADMQTGKKRKKRKA